MTVTPSVKTPPTNKNMTEINYADPEIIHGLTDKHLTALILNNRSFMVTPATREAFLEMRNEALKDGINLSIASSFRNFERQKIIFEEKIAGIRPVLDRNEHPVDIGTMSKEELIRTIMFFSAVPGMSRHHWGTDLDVYDPDALACNEELDLTNRCYTSGSQKNVGKWLTANMQKFGFFRPYAHDNQYCSYELWHISHMSESDRFTLGLDCEECACFLKNRAGLSEPDLVTSIVTGEFAQRFLLFSH